jgi:hypothetical protein
MSKKLKPTLLPDPTNGGSIELNWEDKTISKVGSNTFGGKREKDAIPLNPPPATTPEMEAGTETDPRSMSPANVAEAIAALAEGGSLDTDATILATTDDDLAAKYAEAKALTPNGNPLSKTNRAALVLMPGVYTLSAGLAVDTNYVDVIALGNATKKPSVSLVGGNIIVTAWDVDIIGIESTVFAVTGRANITSGVTGTASTNTVNITNHGLVVGDVISFLSITGGSGLTTNVRYVVRTVGTADTFQLRVESTGANANFTTDITAGNVRIEYNSGQRFTNCKGGIGSFGGDEFPVFSMVSGNFTGCIGGDNSFGGGYYTASGTFNNCIGGNSCFGGLFGGIASGTFTNCIGGSNSFGGQGDAASGTFNNCIGGNACFGFDGTASGTFNNCIGGNDCFGFIGTVSGTFNNCIGGGNSFGAFVGTVSGTFNNCIGGGNSFGGGGGILSGKLYYCRLTTGTFETVSGGGITRYCVDGNNDANNQG